MSNVFVLFVVFISAGAAALMIFGLFLLFRDFSRERAFDRAIAEREPLDCDAFFDAFYPDRRLHDIVGRLRPIYCDFFSVDPAKLRPQDRPPIMDDLDTSELVDEIEKAFSISIPPEDCEALDGSFESVVLYLVDRGCGGHTEDSPAAQVDLPE
jgi:acyl carrier protein